MAGEFEVSGGNAAALFTMKLHRGDGMTLVAMNWKKGKPPNDFVGFAIEYKEPGGDRFYALKNRLSFDSPGAKADPTGLSTLRSPIQKFRWVHFPRNAEMPGEFVYRVTPVFMNAKDELSYGAPQEAPIELRRDTYQGVVNVCFTRGFVSSQAFVDRYGFDGIPKLVPAKAKLGLDFKPTHPKADEAYDWMGFEARSAILEVLDQAIADTKAEVRVVAYDLNEPEVVSRLKKIGGRLKIIIDNEGEHGANGSAENKAADRLSDSAGAANVKRQHMGNLQHNKTIVVDGPTAKLVVCGSTNFSWRGFFVQSNNAFVMEGASAVKTFRAAFDAYWANSDDAAGFGKTASATWTDLGLPAVDARVAFSPHSANNAILKSIGDDIGRGTTSCLLYSLAFLSQTPGVVKDAIKKVIKDDKIFVYGMSDKEDGDVELLKPDGKFAPVYPAALGKNAPPPFRPEPTAGQGVRLHHKFVVIDFDKPTARVYLGSYNFSSAADVKNGENLILVRDRKIAVSYMIEALRTFDHYHFRVAQNEAKKSKKKSAAKKGASKTAKGKLALQKPPRKKGEVPWWQEDYTDPRKIRDRELFA